MRRRLVVAAVVAATVLSTASPVFAHGLGGRGDLPVPFSAFVIGAGLALVISFVMLSARWHEPRLQTVEVRSTRHGSGRWRTVAKVAGLVAFGLVIVDGFLAVYTEGAPVASVRIAPVLIWVYFWLVVPFAAAALGDAWRWLNPFRTIAEWVNGDSVERPEAVTRFGVWPAAVAFVAFTWLELVSAGSGSSETLTMAAFVYTLYIMGATRVFGVETGLRSFDAFSIYNSLIAGLSTFDLDPEPAAVGTAVDGATTVTVARRGWLRAITATPLVPGLTAFVVAMIGTVTYDGLTEAAWWRDSIDSGLRSNTLFQTAALVGVVAVMGTAYLGAAALASKLAGSDRTARDVARSFAHTLVPIGLAYAVAHYFTLILFEGQQIINALSDPFGQGWNLFGTADRATSFFLEPQAVWYVQVAVLVVGHIGGVVLAHDRALAEFGGRNAARSQYAMLVLMVLLTSLGLWLLSGG